MVKEKEKVTKAAVIRHYLAEYPDMGPTALVERIIASNPKMKLSAAEVSTTKTNMLKKNAAETAAASGTSGDAAVFQPGGSGNQNLGSNGDAPKTRKKRVVQTLSFVDKVTEFKSAIDAVGGAEEAKKLLELFQ